MNWKTFFLQIAVASLSGAAQTAGGILVQDPTKKPDWKALGNAALLGALLGNIAHWGQQGAQLQTAASASQPQPGFAASPAS